MNKNKKKGFGSMSPEKRKQIASLGGITANKLGKRHKFSHDEAVKAGKLGGRVRRKEII